MAMSGCSEWRDVLMGYALGEPVEAALEAHLAVCPGCAAELEAWRQRSLRLSAAMRDLTAVEPDPYGPARILARVTAPSGARAGQGWYRHLAFGVSVVILCVAMIFYWPGKRVGRTRRTGATISEWRSPTQSLLKSPADPLLKRVPRLGEGYFEMSSTGGRNVQ